MKRKPYYARWMDRLIASSLDSTSRGIGLWLIRWADASTGVLFPSIATIASETAYSGNTVRKALKRLHKAGCLDVPHGWSKGGPRATHTLVLIWDAPEAAGVATAVTSVSGAEAHAGGTPNDMRGSPSDRADCPSYRAGELAHELTHGTTPPHAPASVIREMERWKGAAIDDDDRTLIAVAFQKVTQTPMRPMPGSDGTHEQLYVRAIACAIGQKNDYIATTPALGLVKTICATSNKEGHMPREFPNEPRAIERPRQRSSNGSWRRETTAERRARERAGQHPEPTGIDSLPTKRF